MLVLCLLCTQDLSVSLAAKFARDASKQGCKGEKTQKLGKVLSVGDGNAERDWQIDLSARLRTLGFADMSPSHVLVELKSRPSKSKCSRPIVSIPTRIPLMHPHDVLRNIFRAGCADRCLGNPSPQRLEAFWTESMIAGGETIQWQGSLVATGHDACH